MHLRVVKTPSTFRGGFRLQRRLSSPAKQPRAYIPQGGKLPPTDDGDWGGLKVARYPQHPSTRGAKLEYRGKQWRKSPTKKIAQHPPARVPCNQVLALFSW